MVYGERRTPFKLHTVTVHVCTCYHIDYSNFKLTNQVARNVGSIFHSHLVSRILYIVVHHCPLVLGSIGMLVANVLNGHCHFLHCSLKCVTCQYNNFIYIIRTMSCY